jgi:hypothetical protein
MPNSLATSFYISQIRNQTEKSNLENITHLLNNHHEHHKLYFKLQNQKHKDHRDSYDLFFPLPTKASRFLYFSTFLKIRFLKGCNDLLFSSSQTKLFPTYITLILWGYSMVKILPLALHTTKAQHDRNKLEIDWLTLPQGKSSQLITTHPFSNSIEQ